MGNVWHSQAFDHTLTFRPRSARVPKDEANDDEAAKLVRDDQDQPDLK